ncbi:MAG: hypothetical protein IKK89_04715 [Alistipes sp.]|nr:hypothetical protein [Alistipes sp.]
MRRRLLLANSHAASGGGSYDEIFGEIPPESTEFGWPLYITVPFKEVVEGSTNRIYYKEPSDIVSKLWDWCIENKEFIETSGSVETYEAYPPELYVNGVRINTMSGDFNLWFGTFENWIFMFDNVWYNEASIYDDFSISLIILQ